MSSGRIILYTGGSRSGKSSAAVEKAKASGSAVCFIATCQPQDDEMKQRVQRHQAERPGGWKLVEEPIHLAKRLAEVDLAHHPVVIIDCLTLWVSNLMFVDEEQFNDESDATKCAVHLIEAARSYGGIVIIITNEVGLGVIPENALARKFVDLAGRCNQAIAAEADEVVLFSCGLPLPLKGGSHESS